MSQDGWGTRVGLILAMAGNAVGLGNFLRFPAQAVKNGGGAFIIPYIVCFFVVGIPLLFVEWSMGRYGGKAGHHSTPFILDHIGNRQRIWKYFGVFGIFVNITVAAYYCYLESWTMAYAYHSIAGTFNGLSLEQTTQFFNDYIGLNSYQPIFFWLICLGINTYLLSRGLSGGIELAAKIGLPLLILFGIFLAYKGYTTKAGVDGAINDAIVGVNFLWTPKYESLLDFKVWLAAAGQIFFTLALGMGAIHCYASYIKANSDIALNAMSAGWLNEFVEVVIGSAILIPISVGYLGIDKVKEIIGFGMGFMTMPYLFSQWGEILSKISGFMWFSLLFFAGITSSLAMGTPVTGFMKDNFNWSIAKGALLFGAIVLILGIPCVLSQSAFNEFDYWAGSVSLVIFALSEIILFAWFFGMDKGWQEITEGADISVPVFFKYIIKYVTPIFLGAVFIGSLPDLWKNLIKETDVWGWVARVILFLTFFLVSLFVRKAVRKYHSLNPINN